MKIKSSEKGQILILIVFAAIGLFAFTALAIDGSMLLSDRRHAQNAADTSAMAAALANTRGQNYTQAAMDRAASNGYDNGTMNDITITVVETPSGGCAHTGLDITVTIVSRINTTFARVIGRTQLTNVTSATARSCGVLINTNLPYYAGNSIFATKPAVCNGSNSSSLYVNGSGNLQIWGGDMGSASTDSDCLRFQGGQTQLKKLPGLQGACADIASAASSGGTFVGVTWPDGCGTKVYGQNFEEAPEDLNITCGATATQSGTTMSPGNYSGTFPPAGVTTLQSGTYCLNGDFRVNAGETLLGNGVTIVMNAGTLKWNGTSQVTLSAPTSGDYQGLLIYAPPSNSYANGNNEINIDGSGNAKLTGTVLVQNLPCYFAGSGQIQKSKVQFICYTWGMDGNGQGEIEYDSSKFFIPVRWIDPTVSLLK